MKNALILHGAGNNSRGNWFPWLKRELEIRQYEVWVPDLPNSDIPNKKDWLEKIYSNKRWRIHEETILIGHSAGATLILRILETLPADLRIHKAILVAGAPDLGTNPKFYKYREDLVKDPFQWMRIKKSCKKFFFFASDRDPYDCGIDKALFMQKHLGGQIIYQPGEGHFNLEKGPQYTTFPALLEKILA